MKKVPPRELFIKGPVPLEWMARASALPGRTASVGLGLWFLAGCTGSRTVRLERRRLGDLFCLDRYAIYRGVNCLEDAGLVRTERLPGRHMRVEILDAPGQEVAA